MDDETFLAQFESCTLPFDQWSHRSHIKVAYLYASRHPLAEATDRMRRGVQAYNKANDVPEGPHMGYHETLTQAWMQIIHTMVQVHGAAPTADEFCDQQPYLLNKLLLRLFYSRPRIMSEQAKRQFVEPDLAPLPRP